MRRALRKITRREFRRTPGRFIALFLIIALGAGVYTGLRSAAPSMKGTADIYFSQTKLADLRLFCDLGITEDDVTAYAARPEVAEVSAGYSVDLNATVGYTNKTVGDTTVIVAVHSLPIQIGKPGTESAITGAGIRKDGGVTEAGISAAGAADESGASAVGVVQDMHGLGYLTLTEGRLPENPGECVADANAFLPLGSTVRISTENDKDTLAFMPVKKFTVVGSVWSPNYISNERGNTNLGNGSVSGFIFVPPESFVSDYYTELNLRLKSTETLSAFSWEYEAAVKAGEKALNAFGEERAKARYEQIKKEAEEKIRDAEQEYRDEQKKVNQELSDAKAKLNDLKKTLQKGETQVQKSQSTLSQSKKTLGQKKAVLSAGNKDLSEGKKALEAGKKELAAARSGLAEVERLRKTLMSRKARETSPTTIALLEIQLETIEQQLPTARREIGKYEKEVAAAEKKVQDAEAAYNEGKKLIAAAEKQIGAGERQLQTARNQLATGRNKIDDGEKEYDKQSKKAEEGFADARAKIEDGKKELADLEMPEWIVQNRQDLPGYPSFSSDVGRIDNLSLTLPWFLFIIAALVCLTTMTRMIDEHRSRIGMLKSLGYQRRHILKMYQLYAWIIGLSGSVMGVVIGVQVYPQAVWNSYSAMYHMGNFLLVLPLAPCLIGILGGTLAIVITTLLASRKALRDSASALIRPKAPKPGKRVFLERIPFLWHPLPFTIKITIRNLLRYKLRFFMTIIGVAGCTALLLTGLGIRDSISGLLDLQFGEITKIRSTILLEHSSNSNADTTLNKVLAEFDVNYAQVNAVEAVNGNRDNLNFVTNLYVPEDPNRLNQFVTFRERVGHKPIRFPPDAANGPAVVITERLARALELSPGDLFTFGKPGEEKVEARVSGIMENYFGNYIYISPKVYEQCYQKKPEFQSVGVASTLSDDQMDARMTEISSTDNVSAILMIGQLRSIMAQVVKNLSAVVWLLIFSAAVLASVVLYNLTNINITERIRELATLKVLGFHKREVSSYISREISILTVIGISIGLYVGIGVHGYVMDSLEINEIMFSRIIHPYSYGAAITFTILCNVIIGLLMRPRLNRIDPVGALKSVE